MWFTFQVSYAPQTPKEKTNMIYTRMAEDVFKQGKVPTTQKNVESLALSLQKYGSGSELERRTVASLNRVSSATNDEKAILDAASCISLYSKSPEEAVKIANKLGELAEITGDERVVSRVASCVSLYEKIPTAAVGIAESLRLTAIYTNGEVAMDSAKLLSLNSATDFMLLFKNTPLAGDIAENFGELCTNTNSEKVLMGVTASVSLYAKVPDAALTVMSSLRNISLYTKVGYQLGKTGSINYIKGSKAVLDTASTVSLFANNPDYGGRLSDSLVGIAYYTKSEDAVSASAGYIANFTSNPKEAITAILGLGSVAFNASNKEGTEGIKESEKAVLNEVKQLSIKLPKQK